MSPEIQTQENPDHSPRRRKMVIALGVIVILLGLFRVLSPSAPKIRFIRFTTNGDGEPVALCRVTNPGIAPMGILGYTPRLAQWRVEDTRTGAVLDSQYVCGTGMSFHSLGPFQSREIEIRPPPGARGVRYGVYYDVPSEFFRNWRERIQSMRGRFGTDQIAWADEIPR